jgi:hypothetical protein
MKCASALVFDDDMNLQPLTPDEFAALDRELQEGIRAYQRVVRAIDRR